MSTSGNQPIQKVSPRSEDLLFLLTAPSNEKIQHFILQQRHSVFSYAEVGATAGDAPAQYNLDRNSIVLGRGAATWRRAVQAVREWKMFEIPWVRLCRPTAETRAGADVAILVHHFGFYSLNACRIVYVVDDDGPLARYGFAYGTLADHGECGEERFTVEWNSVDDVVSYSMLAFSRPNKTLSKLGYPFSRALQRKFAVASKAAMFAAANVNEERLHSTV